MLNKCSEIKINYVALRKIVRTRMKLFQKTQNRFLTVMIYYCFRVQTNNPNGTFVPYKLSIGIKRIFSFVFFFESEVYILRYIN
jgi:hypothetical protein